jgi:hypothetical protein
MEHSFGTMAVEMVPGKHWDFSTYLARRAGVQSGAYADVHFVILEQCSGPLAVEIFPGNQESTAISAPFLTREREICLAHAQK